MEYSGTFVYVLQYNFTFQYLFAWNNEVYRQEITMKPVWHSWRLWLWRFGLLDHPYSEYQGQQGELVMISGAMASIEKLKDDVDGSQRRKAEKRARKKVETNGECQWQARADADGAPIFLCLVHNKSSLLQDNPKHD